MKRPSGKNNMLNYKLATKSAEEIGNSENVWQEYPRPQMVRENWINLNGIWEANGGAIRVPFPPESAFSLYTGKKSSRYVYKKTVCLTRLHEKERVLLHFGAVDQIAEVFVNNRRVGRHEGGYLPFALDVTDAISYEEENKIEVLVTDKLCKDYPYGKQRKKRGGMWYTPVSGIWKSVWIEQVPEIYVERVKITPDQKGIYLEVFSNIEGMEKKVTIALHDGAKYETTFQENAARIQMSEIITENGENYVPRLWSPGDPYLYSMEITMGEDTIRTYFGMREIAFKDIQGQKRLCLNDEPIFLNGVLDQGYFPEGIYVPASEKEYEKDVLGIKGLGFNLLRKHIKVEPEAFYYYCDLHGMLVMQDHVNNGGYSYLRDTALPGLGKLHIKDKYRITKKKRKDIFERHMIETQESLYNHPSIIAYTIFNEGWGQFDTNRMYNLARENDNTRLYDSASGWFKQEKSDFDSRHWYGGPIQMKAEDKPLLISEFGGYTQAIAGHYFNQDNTYGYGVCESQQELMGRITRVYEEMIIPSIDEGGCGCIYTQVSDVEDEINGLYTYDRAVCKVDQQQMRELQRRLEDKIREVTH